MANLAVAASDSTASSASASSSYYDVFINHRGPDVKNTFASHLYRRLLDRGLRAFLDRREMEKGDEISSQIEHAIRGASVHVAIFSPRYAQSNWCLNELVLMKNSRAAILPVFYKVDPSVVRWTDKEGAYAEALRGLEQKTIQDSVTGEKKPRYGFDTIQSWRSALSSVADLSGFTLLGDEDEGELLDQVVETILKKVPKTPLHVAKYPTGLDLKLEEFEKTVLLQQETERVEAKVVGIVGIGGVGKTTLAKKFFNLRRSGYSTSSFLFDVRENARTMSLANLQKKLLEDLKLKEYRIDSPAEGIEILRRHLSFCHALIILDDVNHVNQMEAFLPIKDVISPNSLILVTSRDKHVLKSYGVLESSIYNLEGLDVPQSKELFCSYAFNQPLPPPEFADLVDLFVTACKRLPLSLKVVGALMSGENDKSCWQEQLEQLNRTVPDEILNTLRISYDSLHKEDQPIFLDIACFFIGEDINKGRRIWGRPALRNLENKCLLEVDIENKIKMHDHIRDMGRNIAEELTMPRRLWDWTTNTIDHLLEQPSTVRAEVRGIKMVSFIDAFRDTGIKKLMWFTTYRSSKISPSKYLFNNSNFLGMRNLELVAAEEDHLEGILRRTQPRHLKWLRWYRISHSSLPNWIPMKSLKVLEVAGERLNTLWSHQSQGAPLDLRELNICAPLSEVPKSIGQLKHLERIAIHSPHNSYVEGAQPQLERLPDEFCRLGSLKYLSFKSFSKMLSLPDSFGELANLRHIDLEGASSLQTLPDSFGELANLQHIDLEGASSLQTLPVSFGKLTRLKHLSLSGCKNLTISNGTLGNITTLEYLNLSSCQHLNELPPQVAHQQSLQELYLSGTKLKEIPTVGCDLRVLYLGGDLLEMLPPSLGDLKSLKNLTLLSSPQLKSLPDSIGVLTQLTKLTIGDCGIECLPRSLLKMSILESLEVSGCPLREHPFKKEVEEERETEGKTALNKLNSSNDRYMFGLKRLKLSGTLVREVYFDEGVCRNLQQLTLTSCSELRQIGGLCRLRKLRYLNISNCPDVEDLSGLETLTSLEILTVEKLQSIPGLGQLTKLRTLNVSSCGEIEALTGVEHLTSLESLYVSGCEKLHSIPGLGQLTKLRTLHVYSCGEIKALHGVEHLISLKKLKVSGLGKLKSLQGLGQLTQIIELDVSNCHEISELPGVNHLTSLEKLNISGLGKLKSIQWLGQLTQISKLDVSECHEILELPSLEHLISLKKLKVSGLGKLRSLQGLGQLTQITDLDVSKCHEISELPGVEHLTSLKKLNISGLGKIKSVQWLGQLTKIRELDVGECHDIPELAGLGHLTSLTKLNVSGLGKLSSIQGLGQLTQIRELDFTKCHEISELPGVEHLTSLEKLNISGLGKLKSIKWLGQLTQISELDVSECHEILELTGLEHLISLKKLKVSGLGKLRSLQGLGQLTQITELDVSKCHEISELPGMNHLTSLEKLNISGLGKLKSIQWLGQLTHIRELDVSQCHEIPELPGLEHLTSLEKLNVSGLGKLKGIHGLGQLTQIKDLNVSECHEISEISGVEHLIFLENLNISGLRKLKCIPGLGQTKIRKINVSKCCELQELLGVEDLMSLEILNVCECPKLRWRQGIVEQLHQQLKEGFKYENQRKRCSCLEFLQFLR